MRRLTELAIVGVLAWLLPAFAAAEAPPTGRLPDTAVPLGYELHLTVDPRAKRFTGQARIHLRLNVAADHLWLHARELDVASAELVDAAGKRRKVTLTVRDPSGVAEVEFGARLPAQEADLVIDYSAPYNRRLQGAYKVTVGSDAYVVTQFESISARYAFPGFDEPRFKTPFDLTLTVPKDEVAVANTLPRSEKDSADGKWKTIEFARTRPLPTYLVAFAVGPWDVVDGPPLAADSVRKRPLPLRGIGPRGTGPQLKWILDQAPAIVRFYEEYTGVPYPFDKLDLLGAPDFAAGAMENAGLIVFRDALLRIDKTSPAGMRRTSFNVTAHEIAHQWFGDLVTVPWWNDIWLNEAFATWAQAKATAALKPEFLGDLGRVEGALYAMASDSLLSARRIRQPVVNQGDIENAFDGITYEKGADVLRMFEEWIGEPRYRKAMHAYLVRHAFGSGSSDDLIAAVAEASGNGKAVAVAMRSFLDQPGIPLLHTRLACKDDRATLTVSQTRYLPLGSLDPDNLHWSVPMCVRFGRRTGSTRQCFLVDQPRKEFDVAGGCADWYLPNAGADGYYRFTMDSGDFAALDRHFAALAPDEQMIYADAVKSAFRRGEVGPAVVLATIRTLAGSKFPQVVTALNDELTFIREHLSAGATRTALDAAISRLYEPRLDALGYRHRPGESDAVSRLRQRLASILAFDVRDPAVRKRLDAQGRIALGLDHGGGVDLTRVDPDLRGFALAVAVQDSGKPAFDAVLKDLEHNHTTQERYELVSALGSTRDPALAERARDLGLTPVIAVGEMFRLYVAQVRQPEDRNGFWRWYQAHFDALRTRSPDAYQRYLPHLPAIGRCDKAQARKFEQWFTPRIAKVIGGRRALAQSLEGIEQCAALRTHFGTQSLVKWAEAQHAP